MICFGDDKLRIEHLVEVAKGNEPVKLSDRAEFTKRISASRKLIDRWIEEDKKIYGVNTGYGESCTVDIPKDLLSQLPQQLVNYHSCGVGEFLSEQQGRMTLAVRLSSFCSGFSGVSLELLERMTLFLNKNIIPRIPQEGSVGASGDLTPLSYLASALIGQGQVYYQGQVTDTKTALEAEGLSPYQLKPKEALALMNGTSVMTALACEAFDRATYLSKLSSRLSALAIFSLKGNKDHYNKLLFSTKPHPGQTESAKRIREDLESVTDLKPNRLQDRYSLRCSPHVTGVLEDFLPLMRQIIETELNSTNDNPVIDADSDQVLHGGHFYGGHIAFAMDSLKNLVANIADLHDRQMALLVDSKFNNGLPANLSDAPDDLAAINHGFKAVQIGTSAWTAEALKTTLPASIFSRSTESHNQDKVSMGTIAARDALRVLELTEQVLAAELMTVAQAVHLRKKEGLQLDGPLNDFISSVNFKPLSNDRPLDNEIRSYSNKVRKQEWPLYS